MATTDCQWEWKGRLRRRQNHDAGPQAKYDRDALEIYVYNNEIYYNSTMNES